MLASVLGARRRTYDPRAGGRRLANSLAGAELQRYFGHVGLRRGQALARIAEEGPRLDPAYLETGLVVVLVGHVAGPAGSSLTPRATILSAPSSSGRCSFRASSGGAGIPDSTSSGVVRITGIASGWMAPTSAFGSLLRSA